MIMKPGSHPIDWTNGSTSPLIRFACLTCTYTSCLTIWGVEPDISNASYETHQSSWLDSTGHAGGVQSKQSGEIFDQI